MVKFAMTPDTNPSIDIQILELNEKILDFCKDHPEAASYLSNHFTTPCDHSIEGCRRKCRFFEHTGPINELSGLFKERSQLYQQLHLSLGIDLESISGR